MAWCYSIKARSGQRLLMRVAQIFDQQMLCLSELTWRRCGEAEVEIQLVVSCEGPLAQRIHAKLYHLHDLIEVELRESRTNQTAFLESGSWSTDSQGTRI